MAKKVTYKPSKGGFNLDEKKSFNPYRSNTKNNKKSNKGKKK